MKSSLNNRNHLLQFSAVLHFLFILMLIVIWVLIGVTKLSLSILLIMIILIFAHLYKILRTLHSEKASPNSINSTLVFFRVCFGILDFKYSLLHLNKTDLRISYVDLNNHLVSKTDKITADRIMILLPHCLQKNSCDVRITSEIDNCKECGNCDIATIKDIIRIIPIYTVVATGGTIARMKIRKFMPKLIIACACERDLVEGIREVFPIKVYGILNVRPEGPCYNTKIDIDVLKTAINHFLSDL